MMVLLIVQSAVLVVLAVLVFGLLRSYGAVLQRLHQLDGGESATRTPGAPPFRTAEGVVAPTVPGTPGSATAPVEWAPAHDVSGEGLSGEVIAVRTVGVDHDTVLVFLSSGCSGCTGFWEELADRRDRELFAGARVLVVTKGPEAESATLLGDLAPTGIDLIMSDRAWSDFEVPGSPYVVVIDGHSGRIKGQGSGTSLGQVSGLIRQAFGDGGPGLRSVAKPRADAEREVDVDRALLAAGITPGHRSLYGGAEPPVTTTDTPVARR